MTIQTTYTQARANLARLFDQVTRDREVIIIERRGAEPVALIAADELAGLLETAHLLRSPANAQRLLTALARLPALEALPPSLTLADLRRQLFGEPPSDKDLEAQNQRLSELVQAWYAEPNDLDQTWWDDFEQELQENRLNFRERDLELD